LENTSCQKKNGKLIILKFKIMPTIQLTKQDFIDKVFDYENKQEWQYKGEHPAIIDFYADWCGPCRSVAPTLEQLADEYEGKVDIYKIDTDKETEVSSLFGIQSIPTFLFIPVNGAPMVQRGAIAKNVFKQVIDEKLLKSTVETT
jgi:thioredoxin